MKLKFSRKISVLSNVPAFSIPADLKGSITVGGEYKISIAETTFIRTISILGGVPAVSLPFEKRVCVECGNKYDIVMENGSVKMVL